MRQFVVEKYLTACIARGFQSGLDQVRKSYVHHRKFESYMAEVTWALIVLVSTCLAPTPGSMTPIFGSIRPCLNG